ncbi:hypothetical protein C8J56DRAFT_955398 [Mycena floridula]|nr:hypothetical protein C8J56DRAFT_955398 [Mycena floridula]
MFKSPIGQRLALLKRSILVSRPFSALNEAAVDDWISSTKELSLSDTFSLERLSDLYVTLPTRDGVRSSPKPPHLSRPLAYGHHLAFFHPRNPESSLRADGTDSDFCPPEPYTRRMWAGGAMTWDVTNPLLIGESATAMSTLASVKKKGFDGKGTPMLFVSQKIDYTMIGKHLPSLLEMREHVYLPEPSSGNRPPREVQVPAQKDFTFTYTPSLTTLFRFSALTFNAHHIHLDKDYATRSEGYPERLVHGPLTALMLLETVMKAEPGFLLTKFVYRATNPMIVNKSITICGHWKDEGKTAELWCLDEDGVVGMTGNITGHPRKK